jgi:hypothetical protein
MGGLGRASLFLMGGRRSAASFLILIREDQEGLALYGLLNV